MSLVMSQLLSTILSTLYLESGAKVAEKLEKVGLNNVQDLLFHLPLRYEDRTRIYPIIQTAWNLGRSPEGDEA